MCSYNNSVALLEPSSASSRFWHLPADASAHGPALDHHLVLNLWILLALLGLLHVLLIAGILFRRRAPNPIHRFTLEYLLLAAFTLLFALLGLRAQRLWTEHRYTGANPAAMQVEVTGMQFLWYFRYPGHDRAFGHTSLTAVDPGAGNPLGIDPHDVYGKDDIVAGQLVLPAGREVDLTLRAQDVIHGFAIPEMRLKQNAIPGQDSHIHFTPEIPGTYAILCTQICGLGHFRMQAVLRVLPEPEFNSWLAEQEAAKVGQLGLNKPGLIQRSHGGTPRPGSPASLLTRLEKAVVERRAVLTEAVSPPLAKARFPGAAL